jgi:hypothetical protein
LIAYRHKKNTKNKKQNKTTFLKQNKTKNKIKKQRKTRKNQTLRTRREIPRAPDVRHRYVEAIGVCQRVRVRIEHSMMNDELTDW